MDYTWASDSTLPPPSYEDVMGGNSEVASGGDLSFVDFLPECCAPGGLFTKPTYESFRNLIDRGNKWLRLNPQWEAKTCESVEFKTRHDCENTQKMTYLESEHGTCYIRGLRLWIVPRVGHGGTPQQIGYVNLVPERTSETLFGTPTYESLTEMLRRFNNMNVTSPLPGRVITVESQEMKLRSFADLDPDRSYWVERGNVRRHFLVVIRIFFEFSTPTPEEVGVVDFVPNRTKDGGLFSLPKYEPFSNVVSKASNWCRTQNLRICNVQSFEVKLKAGNELDTTRMSYTEHNDRTTYYVRIVRVAFTKELLATGQALPPHIHQLTCKSFVPVLLSSGVFNTRFETLDQTKLRVVAWVKATGAQVISAQTVAMRLFTGGEARYGEEASFTYNRSDMSEHWIVVIQLFLNGFYHEPPPQALPPLPQVQDDGCCIIL